MSGIIGRKKERNRRTFGAFSKRQGSEMKFTGGKYAITLSDEESILNKIDAYAASKMHDKTHSILLVMLTTMGIAKGEHSSIVNQTIVLEDLFSNK